MEKVKSKRTNRIISFACLGVFICSLGIIVGLTAKTIVEYNHNLELQRKRDEILAEQKRLEEISEELGNDDYYTVYVEGGFSTSGSGTTIVVFSK